ncbi:hypothetical protein DAPPUDRAFT_320214 [Daphnia pulex]|uniref:Uncharacterized protein n=1 Tax=Daphnia pulex TaxID=6669 RepID=E9GP66_DAPPU|nr:hypothetical protein DAPPUDRAFT_320214 [Daphnia pulex]|eukprot:EFX78586.1 hypothetical protein DAPPUDRAFT_320214 [Daphnia pulex]
MGKLPMPVSQSVEEYNQLNKKMLEAQPLNQGPIDCAYVDKQHTHHAFNIKKSLSLYRMKEQRTLRLIKNLLERLKRGFKIQKGVYQTYAKMVVTKYPCLRDLQEESEEDFTIHGFLKVLNARKKAMRVKAIAFAIRSHEQTDSGGL